MWRKIEKEVKKEKKKRGRKRVREPQHYKQLVGTFDMYIEHVCFSVSCELTVYDFLTVNGLILFMQTQQGSHTTVN